MGLLSAVRGVQNLGGTSGSRRTRGGLSIEIKGLDELFARLGKVVPSARLAGAALLNDAAERVLAASQELVPVDTGALRASGTVILAHETENGEIRAGVSYGGDAKLYAVLVHEDLSLHHEAGQAKFLEAPFLAAQSNIIQGLERAIKEAIGG